MHIVAKAALRALTTWLTTGQAPPVAPRIDVAPGATPQVRRNADGIALGGIRTPPVDVPVAVAVGRARTEPVDDLPAARLDEAVLRRRGSPQLYPSRAAYLQRYDADADATIKAGFVLPEDRAALLAFAEPSRIAG